MLVSTYGSLLRTPGVARIIAAQLAARFPNGMLSLAYLLHIERIHHSYGAAGLVLAALCIGQAIAGPLTSRWMGAWGMRRVLTLTAATCATSMVTIAVFELPVPAYMVIAFFGGLSTPPIQSAVRTIYPKLVNERQLTALFSLDASAQEIIWVVGPVITTFVAVQISTTLAILLAVVFLVGGGAWFILSPEVGRVRIPRSTRKLGAVLRKRAVLLSTITGFLLVGAWAATEAAVVATFGDRGPQAGVILALCSIGSLIGGLSLGHLPVSPWSLARRMLVVFVGLALALASLEFWWIALALVIAGVGIAPALAVMFAIVSSTVKFSETAEAYGWIGTGQLIGAALGSAVAGFVIDARGASGGYWAAAAFALLGVLLPTLLRRWHPDLRGRASSVPDTEPVPIQPS
jgi:MFS family permease